MKKHKKPIFVVSTLAALALIVFQLNASFAAGPTQNPPLGPVVPTFDGLTVTGNTDIRGSLWDSSGTLVINDVLLVTGSANFQGNLSEVGSNPLTIADDLLVTGPLYLRGELSNNSGTKSLFETVRIADDLEISGTLSDYDSPLTISDELIVDGDIKSSLASGTIGSYYTYKHQFAINGSMMAAGNPKANGYRVFCRANDPITGCSASFEWLEPWDTNDRFLGTAIFGNNTCSGRADDGAASSTDYVTVYARCFDPNGIYSGEFWAPSGYYSVAAP